MDSNPVQFEAFGKCLLPVARPLKNVHFCSISRKAILLQRGELTAVKQGHAQWNNIEIQLIDISQDGQEYIEYYLICPPPED